MAIECPTCQHSNPDDTLYCGKCGTRILGHVPDSPESGTRPKNSDDKPPQDRKIPPSGVKDRVSVTRTLETTADELARGTIFAGRYEIIEELGAGGMGQVYRAFDKKIEEEVALKLIRPEIAAEKRTVERFRNEIKTARKITHKNVCRTHDLGEEGRALYITMEYVRGEDLKSVIRRMRALTVGTAVSIARQVAEGLGEAHRLGIVHRDLKPGNIMIDKEGNAKIMDFGIARSLARAGTTAEGAIIGTPEYMSPEQVEGKPADQRADIYSLGIILFEMVTGRPPFEGETSLAVAHKHRYEPAPDPRTINPQLPADLGRLILRCLEKEREKRFQTTEELLADLASIEETIPTTERTSISRAPTKRKPTASRKITVEFTPKKLLIPAVALLVLIAAAIALMKFFPRKERALTPVSPAGPPSLAVLYFKNNTGDEKLDYLRDSILSLIITDLSQSRYVEVLSENRLVDILKELNQLEARTYSAKVLRQVATMGGVRFLLLGSYTRAGENYRINYDLQESASGKIIDAFQVDCPDEGALFSQIDELTKRIKSGLKISPDLMAGDIDEDVGTITTGSPEAWKYYAEAVRAWYTNKNLHPSIDLLEKAISIDREFGAAYLFMGQIYADHSLEKKRIDYFQKALDLSHRLSVRERCLIEADYYRYSSETVERSILSLDKLLAIYPEDTQGNQLLGLMFLQGGEFERAIFHFDILWRKGKFEYAIDLITCYILKGQFKKAIDLADSWAKVAQGPMAGAYLAFTLIASGELARAFREADLAVSRDPLQYWATWAHGQVLLLRGEFPKAEAEYQILEKNESPLAQEVGRALLANIYLTQGQYRKAEAMFKTMADSAQARGDKFGSGFHRFYLSYIYSRTGNTSQCFDELRQAPQLIVQSEFPTCWNKCNYLSALAVVCHAIGQRQAIAEISREIENIAETTKSFFPNLGRFVLFSRSLVDLADGNYAKANPQIQDFMQRLPNPVPYFAQPNMVFYELLASALYRAGDLEKAREAYEKIISHYDRFEFGDIYSRSFYWLGKICEQKGEAGRASGYYRQFLDLWKDADAGLPEVEDAKKRLAIQLD